MKQEALTSAIASRLRASALLDAYGKLLRPHQLAVSRLYHDQDLSLSEIAELEGVSRQAVHDLLQRVSAQLEALDRALGLVQLRRDLASLAVETRNVASELAAAGAPPQLVARLNDLAEAVASAGGGAP